MKKLLIISGLILCFPTSAAASPLPPYGQQRCDAAGTCVDLAAGVDKLRTIRTTDVGSYSSYSTGELLKNVSTGQLGFDSASCSTIWTPSAWQTSMPTSGCLALSGQKIWWALERFHEWRKATPYQTLVLIAYASSTASYVSPTAASITTNPAMNTADCGLYGENYRYFVRTSEGIQLATLAAPQSLVDACGVGRVPEGTDPAPTTPPTDTTTVAPSIAVAKVQSCPALTYRGKRIGVTSTGATCTTARTVLAKFVGSKYEAPGWVCVQLRVGTARVASCGTPGKSGKRVVGRWRV